MFHICSCGNDKDGICRNCGEEDLCFHCDLESVGAGEPYYMCAECLKENDTEFSEMNRVEGY
jgi:hypothetical protein